MLDLSKVQDKIWENKKKKGFNTTDVNLEFCYLLDELAEAHQAYIKKRPGLGEELADVAIYLLSLVKMLNIDIEKEILAKIEKNRNREYQKVDGALIRTKEAKTALDPQSSKPRVAKSLKNPYTG